MPRPRPTLLSIGECMVELAPETDGRYALGFAGDTFNTAWYARRLAGERLDVAYMTAVGDDPVSDRMVAMIGDAGIAPEIARIPGATVGLYLISLDEGERSFSYWRSTSAARRLADGLTALPRVGAGDMVYVSGITFAILPVEGREALLGALVEARGRGVTVAFDPNLRPKLWASADEMRDWITRAAGAADIALPSHADEAEYFGDAGPGETLARYNHAGVRVVAVKDGPGEVLTGGDGPTLRITPPAVTTPVDTTGAGDSFNAGFLVSWLSGAPLDASAAEGCRVAARVIGARGALVPL